MSKSSSSKARIVLFVLTVVLFVLGSGAPEAGGGVIESARMLLLGF